MARLAVLRMGRQPDGGFLVSSGQRVEGGLDRLRRPADRPGPAPVGRVLRRPEQDERLPRRRPTGSATGPRSRSAANAGLPRPGLVARRPRLFASTDQGHVQDVPPTRAASSPAAPGSRVRPRGDDGQPRPRRDGDHARRLAAVRRRGQPQRRRRGRPRPRNAPVREYPVQNLPFEPRLTEDERTLVVSNWGGRLAQARRAGRPRARTSTSWSTSAARRPRAPSA